MRRRLWDDDGDNIDSRTASPGSPGESLGGREMPALPSRMSSLRAAAVREAAKLLPTITPELLVVREPVRMPPRQKTTRTASPNSTISANSRVVETNSYATTTKTSWVYQMPPSSPAGSSTKKTAASNRSASPGESRSPPVRPRRSPQASPERLVKNVDSNVAARLGYRLAKAEEDLAITTTGSYDSSESPPLSRGKFGGFHSASGGLAGNSPGIQALLSLCAAGEDAGMQRAKPLRAPSGSPSGQRKVGKFGYPLLDSDEL